MIFHARYGNDFPIRKLVHGCEIDENTWNLNYGRNVAVDYESTRLERLLFRLEAQHRSLNWAFGEIADKPGPVFELGLGHGRTYDHMRRHLPKRDIFVFDREIDCFPDCTPPADRLILGKLSETLPQARFRFAGKAVLVNSDVGTYDAALNTDTADVVSASLPALLAPGAIVLSDLPLNLSGATALPLPAGVRSESYFIYRMG